MDQVEKGKQKFFLETFLLPFSLPPSSSFFFPSPDRGQDVHGGPLAVPDVEGGVVDVITADGQRLSVDAVQQSTPQTTPTRHTHKYHTQLLRQIYRAVCDLINIYINSTLRNRPIENCMGLITRCIEIAREKEKKLGLSEIVQLVSAHACGD